VPDQGPSTQLERLLAVDDELDSREDMIECPHHKGAFDCTPFCPVCEGEQEVPYKRAVKYFV
jgi:hypothetical protein